jgi:hypothetical protein
MDNKYFSLGNKVIGFVAFIYLISGNVFQLKNDINKSFEIDITNNPEKENNNNTTINKFFSKINIYLNILAIVFVINIIIYNIQKNKLKDLNDIIQTNLKTSLDSTIFSFNISIFMLVFPNSSIFLIISMLLYIKICKLTIGQKLTPIFNLNELLTNISNLSNNSTTTKSNKSNKSNKLNYYIYGLLFVVILSNIFISNYPNFYYKYYLIYIFVIVIFLLISLTLYKFRNIKEKCDILFVNKTQKEPILVKALEVSKNKTNNNLELVYANHIIN